jgi:hypothetical protein
MPRQLIIVCSEQGIIRIIINIKTAASSKRISDLDDFSPWAMSHRCHALQCVPSDAGLIDGRRIRKDFNGCNPDLMDVPPRYLL